MTRSFCLATYVAYASYMSYVVGAIAGLLSLREPCAEPQSFLPACAAHGARRIAQLQDKSAQW